MQECYIVNTVNTYVCFFTCSNLLQPHSSHLLSSTFETADKLGSPWPFYSCQSSCHSIGIARWQVRTWYWWPKLSVLIQKHSCQASAYKKKLQNITMYIIHLRHYCVSIEMKDWLVDRYIGWYWSIYRYRLMERQALHTYTYLSVPGCEENMLG